MAMEEEGGMLVETAAAALASLDGMAALIEDFSVEMRRQWGYVTSPPEGALLRPLVAFFRRVNWTEPWLLLLMLFHIALLSVAIKSRDNNNMQMLLFTSGLVSIYLAEKVNGVLERNWSRFSRRPYFDREGLLVSTVWSAPLLLMGAVILLHSLYTLTQLVSKWKKAELKYRAHLERKKRG